MGEGWIGNLGLADVNIAWINSKVQLYSTGNYIQYPVMTGEPRGFSRVAAGFSSYDGEFRISLVLAQGSPIFHSSCEGKLGIALE